VRRLEPGVLIITDLRPSSTKLTTSIEVSVSRSHPQVDEFSLISSATTEYSLSIRSERYEPVDFGCLGHARRTPKIDRAIAISQTCTTFIDDVVEKLPCSAAELYISYALLAVR
jgi:phosphatidylinositol kinase/protein kinase (PI-3  family)